MRVTDDLGQIWGITVRILKVYDGDYPWDVRVEKVVMSLIEAGHRVRLVCRNRGRARRQIQPDGLEIVRLPALPDVLSFPFFLNPIWLAAVQTEIRSFRPHRLLIRDLPLAPLGVVLGRRAGVPVIADLAEPYPDSLRSQRQFQPRRALDFVVRSPALADRVERWLLPRVDRALVVCPEAGARLERRGLAPDRWTEVGNTPVLDRFVPRGGATPGAEEFSDRFLLLFTGLLAGDRGLDVALDAMAFLRERYPRRFGMLIVGEGPMRTRLERQCTSLGLETDVRFAGWIEHALVPDYIARAQAGLLPFRTCPHIDSTLANKLFDYMALGLPVIAVDVPPMRRVLAETNAGTSFQSGDSRSLAEAIEQLADDPKRQRALGEAGRRAARETYNWGVDGQRLLAAIEQPIRPEST